MDVHELPSAQPKVGVFVSSTFTDTKAERNVLMRGLCVVPKSYLLIIYIQNPTNMFGAFVIQNCKIWEDFKNTGERGGSVVECRTPKREVGGSRPTAAVLCL